MRELDISTWKEFRIGDLFNVVTKTAKHPKFKKLKESEGSVSTPAVLPQLQTTPSVSTWMSLNTISCKTILWSLQTV